ncbi:uncharacterized protein BXZ73DRAFT_102672 [Epithele typhae]|uniref:uncharacterized protein n=1 Tax=Epithele typhae TaxID=378194 RepID=UPI002008550C|nr:uncharacterized protein BXZ73DRAFT_102672 [Epithele typhae]KAH9927076.1 hypothetical protein BXZ73DRAFT_102672 [Epithele typhae]
MASSSTLHIPLFIVDRFRLQPRLASICIVPKAVYIYVLSAAADAANVKFRTFGVEIWKPKEPLYAQDEEQLQCLPSEHGSRFQEFCVKLTKLMSRPGGGINIGSILTDTTESQPPSGTCALIAEVYPMELLTRDEIERYAPVISPPLEVIIPSFSTFVALSSSLDLPVPEEIVRRTGELMHLCSALPLDHVTLHDEVFPVLSSILGFPVEPGFCCNTPTATAPPPRSDTAVLTVIGLGIEDGYGGRIAQSTYIDYYRSPPKIISHSCSVPSFLIGIAGPRMSIFGATIARQPIVQRLTRDLWLARDHPLDDAVLLENARVLYALARGLESLRAFYATLGRLPTPDARIDADEPGHRDVVVKFVSHYGADAHRLLASAKLAPQLLYCGDVWVEEPRYHGHKMVVMEYVEGVVAFCSHQQNAALPEVTRAIGLLHAGEMVLGYVHGHNVLLLPGWEENAKDKVRIIGFDWAGRVGEARYPCRLPKQVFAVDGVKEYGFIDPAHDTGMLASFCSAHGP